MEDSDGTLWLATLDGLVNYDSQTQQLKRYVKDPNDNHSLEGKRLAKLMLDSNGVLWVASDGGGIAIFEKTQQFPLGRFTNHKWVPGQAGSLNSNVVRKIYEDRNGDVWVGNFPSGINFFDRSTISITFYSGDGYSKSVSQNSILAVKEDAQHNLWIGTDGDGLIYRNRKTNQLTTYKNDPSNPVSISGNAVVTVFVADDGKVWLGTWGAGVSILNPATGTFERMPFDVSRTEANSISTSKRLNSSTVWAIKQDKQKNIWFGTHTAGLSKFDQKTGAYTHYINNLNDSTSITRGVVWSILVDSKENMWVGTARGLDLMDVNTGTFKHYKTDLKDSTSLSNPRVMSIFEDSKQRLWIGTDSGLNLMNSDKKTFTVYNKSHGFNNDTFHAIVEDAKGLLWLTTGNGISIFNPETKQIKNINRDNGRLMGVFNENSGLRSSADEIIFGSDTGLRIIDPKKMEENNVIPPMVFTGFKIFTDDVKVGDNTKILAQSLNYTDTIVLDYKKSMFQLSFAALNFRDSQKNQYAYKLEGFDSDWLQVGAQHSAGYTNLNVGTYVFHVKGSNNDGLWNNEGASITVIQLPPPWKTWWAYTFYGIALLLVVAALVRSQQKKLAYERMINLQMRKLDTLKENFLANTSHELRTPINGIIGLAESISANYNDLPPEELKQKAKMILSSGKRLENIVKNILEFSQLANNELTLTLNEFQLRPIIASVLADLQDNIRDKSLHVVSDVAKEVVVYANAYRLAQIMYRLIDNAIKFTQEGTITIAHHRNLEFDCISVSDTGIGIAPENIAAIFSSFQQVDGSAKRAAEGAGLGLSVIQKLIELHKGEIKVESVVGKGTTISICLPCKIAGGFLSAQEACNNNNHSHKHSLQADKDTEPLVIIEKIPEVHNLYFNSHLYADETFVPAFVSGDTKYKILVVDDDPVNRMVVKAHLRKQHFNTVEAVDGNDALKIMSEQSDIDLIILDVMMPHMTGYEACEILRKKYSLHDLPIIFLTANHQSSEIIKAFSVGGNDFMTKPVVGTILFNKVNVHLSLLEESRKLSSYINANTPVNALKNINAESLVNNSGEDNFSRAENPYLNLQQAVANIIEQTFLLIAPIELIGCWIQNDDNNFECIENKATLPSIGSHQSLTWQELERLTDVVGKANKNISLVKNLKDAARDGRLGKNFVNVWELYCELIFRDNFIVGFIIIGGSISKFMTPEDNLVLLQCQTHIAAAVTKMQKMKAFSYNAERTLS